MSDFSSISIDPKFPLLPDSARRDGYFQSKEMPDDDERVACIDGTIRADGMFVREDGRGKFWNPSLNGWIELLGHQTGAEFICRFEDGFAIEIKDGEGIQIDDNSPLPGAYWSPNNWQKL